MTSDVVLSSAMRSNLLSLQGTQSQIDITQNRLSTGKKINSALDGPQSFFASQALTNRASDLNRLLDSIGQSIQVIKAADNGITALSKLVEQADSIASQARDALAAGEAEARVTGTVDLRNIDDLSDVAGLGSGGTLNISVTDPTDTTNTTTTAIAVGATTIESFVTSINNIRDADGQKVIEAKLDAAGKLSIRSTNGGDLSIDFVSGVADDDGNNLAFAAALGFGDVAKLVDTDGDTTNATNNVSFTQVAKATLDSRPLQGIASGEKATRSTAVNDLEYADGTDMFAGIANDDMLTFRINGGSSVEQIDLGDGTSFYSLQSIIDQINTNANLSGKIEASFDEKTGQFSIKAIDGKVESLEIGLHDSTGAAASAGTANLGFVTLVGGTSAEQTVRFGAAAAQLATFEQEFNNIREQITQLVSNGDTAYRGTNLLDGDDLLTVFNENRSSSLNTEGVTFTAEGLGLEEANFSRKETVDLALETVRDALGKVRDFGSTLANDLSIIQARQTFTSELVNTLKEGSAKLVDADQNEEGAKLLALQTRQSLGVTALSLASQSQQSILRLF